MEVLMKTLFRILIVATCIGIVVYYTNEEPFKTEMLEGPATITKPVVDVESKQQNLNGLPRPSNGISIYIGKSIDKILDNYGKPNRVDQSKFGYKWWIYHSDNELLMFGITDDRVTQVYTNSVNVNTEPYKIGQTLDDVYRMTIFEEEVAVEIEDNVYMFAMNELDMHNRILVRYDDVYVQLYIDNANTQLQGVRFIDGETLVLHKPYELQYVGELIEASTPSSYAQVEINLANARQLTELTNSLRMKNDLPALEQSNVLSSLAGGNSERMFLDTMESQTIEVEMTIEEQLKEMNENYQQLGENVATNYTDPIEVLHGWMNSKEHRALLLSDEFTHIGSGAYVNYYTQLYMQE